MYETSLLSSAVVSASLFLLGFIGFYLVCVFFFGLMLYYFTGSKPGAFIVAHKMQLAARLYAHTAMFIATLTGLMAFSALVQAVLGALFPAFVYSVYSRSQAGMDLRSAFVYGIFAVIVFGAHWALAYFVETKRQRMGTLLSKVFIALGLMITGAAFFGSLLTFLMQMLAYLDKANSVSYTSPALPGASLALFLAAGPFWCYYIARTVMWVGNEKKLTPHKN